MLPPKTGQNDLYVDEFGHELHLGPRRMSAMAIAGFVVSFLPFLLGLIPAVIALVLNLVALGQTRPPSEYDGRGLMFSRPRPRPSFSSSIL